MDERIKQALVEDDHYEDVFDLLVAAELDRAAHHATRMNDTGPMLQFLTEMVGSFDNQLMNFVRERAGTDKPASTVLIDFVHGIAREKAAEVNEAGWEAQVEMLEKLGKTPEDMLVWLQAAYDHRMDLKSEPEDEDCEG